MIAMKKTMILLVAVLGAIAHAHAQKLTKAGEFGYQASFPMGDFKDFVGKTSWVGFNLTGRHYMPKAERLSLGINLCWFYFPDKQGRKTVDLKDQGTYTGYVTNYTNIYGLNLVAQYDLQERHAKLVPYVRAGIGGAYQNQRTDIGLYAFKSDGIQLLLNAELGLRFSKDGQRGFLLSGTFHQLPAASDMVSTQFLGVKLGIFGFH